MTGHVFHPGHHELHGMTVVLETTGDVIYVGRFDSTDDHGVHLLDAGIFRRGSGEHTKEEYLRRSLKFGIRADAKHLVVPGGQVASIRRLADLEPELTRP